MTRPSEQTATFHRRSTDPLYTPPPADDTAVVMAERKALKLVLEQSQEVKNRVAKCSEELGAANEIVKQKFSELTGLLSAQELLSDSETIQLRVKECADDLHNVNHILARAIDNLKHSEISLRDALELLASTEAALAAAEDEKRQAALLALHDQTTGLPNRRLFDDRLAQAISVAERHHWTLAVMFLDLDRFKNVNDAFGHAAGDEVLIEVARRLALHTRDEDTACRNGGDEFLFLLMNPQGRENIARIADVILKTTAAPLDTGRLDIVIKASIGIAVYPDNGTTGDELIKNADSAMYKAKELKSGYVFW